VDIYLIRPDGTGLRRISDHGNFCGGPKWTPDSKSVIAYCMSAEESYTYRSAEVDGETRLVQIDIAFGATKPVPAGPGIKIYPSLLASGEIAYVRNDKSFACRVKRGHQCRGGQFIVWIPAPKLHGFSAVRVVVAAVDEIGAVRRPGRGVQIRARRTWPAAGVENSVGARGRGREASALDP
jgi:hypothetical protein